MQRTTSNASTVYSDSENVTTGEEFDEPEKKKVANLSALEEELTLLSKTPEDKRTRKQIRRIDNIRSTMKALGKQLLPKANWGGKRKTKKRRHTRRRARS
jgi:flagellar hook-length control protein FliK